jgi:hypothetical protein
MPQQTKAPSGATTAAPDAAETGDADQDKLRQLQLQRRAQQARGGDAVAQAQKLIQQGVRDPQKYAVLIAQNPDATDGIVQALSKAFGETFAAQVKARSTVVKTDDDGGGDGGGDKKDGGDDDKPLLRHDFDVGKDTQVEVSGGYNKDDQNGAYASADLQNKDGSKSIGVTGYVDPLNPTGTVGGNVHGTLPVGKDGSLTAQIGGGLADGKPQIAGQAEYKDSKNDATLKGTFSDKDNYDVQGNEQYNINDKVNVSGGFERQVQDGAATNTFTAGAEYAGDKVHADGEVDVTQDGSGVGVEAKGTGTVALKDGKLYGEVLAGGGMATDGSTIYHFGGGLTFTPTDNTALTAVGVMTQDGGIDTRLQFDIFKDKVQSASDLSDAKKKAVIGLFVEYSHNMSGDSPFNDSMGAADWSHPVGGGGDNNQVTAGVSIRF